MIEFSFVTYTDDNSKSFALEETSNKTGLTLEYTGLDIPYEKGVNIKIKWIQDYINKDEGTDNKIILFLDAYDTLVTNKFDKEKLIKVYKDYDCDILFSSENRMYKFNNGNTKTFKVKGKILFKRLHSQENFTPNCGVMMGTKKSIKKYCSIMEKLFEKNTSENTLKGATGDTFLFFKGISNNAFDKLNIKIDDKEKLFLTLNNETFIRYLHKYKKGPTKLKLYTLKDIQKHYFKYEKIYKSTFMILHITGINTNIYKNNVYDTLYKYYIQN